MLRGCQPDRVSSMRNQSLSEIIAAGCRTARAHPGVNVVLFEPPELFDLVARQAPVRHPGEEGVFRDFEVLGNLVRGNRRGSFSTVSG